MSRACHNLDRDKGGQQSCSVRLARWQEVCREPSAATSLSVIASPKTKSCSSNLLRSARASAPVTCDSTMVVLSRSTPEPLAPGTARETVSSVCSPGLEVDKPAQTPKTQTKSFSVVCCGLSFLSLHGSLFPLLWFCIGSDQSGRANTANIQVD